MSLTAAQNEAVAARGNVLVVAGAGTGKTSTLVARCLSCLLDEKPPASLDEILMVTFTEAAAAEMRQRIREQLEEKLSGHSDRLRWMEQLALFDTAHIGTLHSFCLQLVRQHFYELELDPQLTVLPEEEAKLLADETLENILQAHYAGKTEAAEAVQLLIQAQGRGWDQPIRTLVLRLHHYTQTLRDPEGWFASQLAMFESPEPVQWDAWLVAGVCDWRERWLPGLRGEKVENKKAAECAAILKELPEKPTREQCAGVLEQVRMASLEWPRGKKTDWIKPLEGFFEEAIFLGSLARMKGKGYSDVAGSGDKVTPLPSPLPVRSSRGEGEESASGASSGSCSTHLIAGAEAVAGSGKKGNSGDPMVEDWNWVRLQMATLLELAREFTTSFSEAKRELGAVDFHDLEQHALRLLWDRKTKQPTSTARQWRNKLRFVFVDEYQDINDAQDAILKALSREGAAANRFLVGDVKQSIYRFRLADPHIFQNYVDTWRGGQGKAIPLLDNFRSREAIINFINSLFGALMRREVGSVPYGEEARLRFGNPENRAALGTMRNAAPRVELHLRLKGAGDAGATEGEGESARAWTEILNLEEAGKEARLIALRLRELRAGRHLIWDEPAKAMRPVEWGDMAVLMRSPRGKAESYAKEFIRLGVPVMVARGGFYESMEITDLLSLLQLLDNPLQDLPVLAALHSPLVGMSLDELAAIRLILPKGHLWTALQRYYESSVDHPGWGKADRFLKNFAAWRRLARQISLSRCLEAVLSETHYAAWLLTQPRGEQRHANVQRLLALAQQFDQFQRQGLFRFLHFIEAQQVAETEPEVAAVSGENSVSLMSIHQSKGLEFPVVVVADLGKPFNLSDLRAEIILDGQYGLCPQIKPPHTGQRYPSLPYWLARQRQKQESLGEELRLLYVAMTRARDTLILSGTVGEKKFQKQWGQTADLPMSTSAGPQQEEKEQVVSGKDGGRAGRLKGTPRPSEEGEGIRDAVTAQPTSTLISTASLLAARNYLDWIAAWSVKSAGALLSRPAGENTWFHWTIYDDLDKRLLDEAADNPAGAESDGPVAILDEGEWKKLHQRLAWQYPHAAATHEPAKTSVSALRRRLADETDAEAKPLFKFQIPNSKLQTQNLKGVSTGKLPAEEIGTAHHTFLELVSLEQAGTLAGLKQEAQRMEREQALSAKEIAHLDFPALAGFWQSDIGKKIRAQSKNVRRELAFTARFSPEELKGSGERPPELFDEEIIVVQGVADLAVVLPEEIWLVDFKTDHFAAANLAEKVKLYEPQLRLYALALSRIYRRPVRQIYLHFLAVGRSVALKEEG